MLALDPVRGPEAQEARANACCYPRANVPPASLHNRTSTAPLTPCLPQALSRCRTHLTQSRKGDKVDEVDHPPIHVGYATEPACRSRVPFLSRAQ